MKSARARPASAGPTAAEAKAKGKIAPARAAAFEILTMVGADKGHSDELLHSPRTAALSPEDRNLATALVMGVLRWQIALDAHVGRLLARPGQRLAEPVALALRMGAFQLLHMDRIPDHAALSQSVELCRAAGHPHAAGMVNAVLRKLIATRSTYQRKDERPPDFAEHLGHPRWLVDRWTAAYGRAAAIAICEYGQSEPKRGAFFSDAVDERTDETDEKMDDGSRLVAEIAAAAMPPASNPASVWDCCAAPGGKTLVLGKRLDGANILATDISARRLAQMAARLRRHAYADRVRTAVMDASHGMDSAESDHFDLILCDVPCSGTGTLARNPEIRHRLRPEDLVRQAERQRAILRGALRRLAHGGRLLYATCSLEPEENEAVLEEVMRNGSLDFEVRRISIAPLIESLGDRGVLRQEVAEGLVATAVRNGALRTLPGVHGCDGFFAVVAERD